MKNLIRTFLIQVLFISPCFAGQNPQSLFSGARIILDRQTDLPKDIVLKEGSGFTVESFFQAYRSAYHLSPENQLSEFRSFTDRLGQTHRRFKQYYKGLELAEVQFLLHEKDGLVHHANGRLIQGLNLNVNPTLSKSAALQYALDNINAKRYNWENPLYKGKDKELYPKGKLMISAGNKEQRTENFRLVYRFEIYTVIPTGGYAVDVDANSGKIVGKHALVFQNDVEGEGETLYNGLQPIMVSDQDFPKPAFAHLDDWNAYGGSGQSWWFADSTLGNEGGYGNNWYQVLDTDTLTLSGDNLQLSFYQRYSTEVYDPSNTYEDYDGWDGMNVRISLDSGLTWQVLENPIPAYTSANTLCWYLFDEGKGVPSWNGKQDEWTQVVFDLSSYLNQTIQIRFAFSSDIGISTANLPDAFGWQIDDIFISNSSQILYSNTGIESNCTPGSIWNIEDEGLTYKLHDFSRGDGILTLRTEYLDDDHVLYKLHTISDDDSLFDDSSQRNGVSVHWATEATYDYYLERFNRDSYDNKGSVIKSETDAWIYYNGLSPNNAAWYGSYVRYGEGDGTYVNPLVSLDVVGHEITHGVTQHSAGLLYENESGALNESFSDIFGASVEFYKEGEKGDWLLGEDFVISGYSRSLQNPKSKYDPDTYKGRYWVPYAAEPDPGNDCGGVHTNSGVQNHWFYLLSEGGSGSNDNGDAYSVNGIGIEDAEQIAYRNLTVYLTPTSQFADARLGAIYSAIDLFGLNSPQQKAVEDAWYAVGVYLPFAGPYAENCSVDNISKRAGQDTLKILAKINNSYEQNIIVKTIIENFAKTVADTITLYDDGLHQDSLAADNYFGGSWPVSRDEDSYNIHINTLSPDSGYDNIVRNSAYFTTIGPLVLEQFDIVSSDTTVNPGDRIKFEYTLRNTGLTAAARNITSTITALDTFATIIRDVKPSYGDVAPGETATGDKRQYIKFSKSCPDNSSQKFELNIYSDGIFFWRDTMAVQVKTSTGLDEENQNRPDRFVLEQNYPNPFNPKTVISYKLPVISEVELSIFNILGQKVATLVSKRQAAGNYKVEWDAGGYSSGVYYYRLETGQGFVQSRKLVVLK